MRDSYYGPNRIPVAELPLSKIYELLDSGVSYSDGDPTVPVSDEDWGWILLRFEIEIIRRRLGLPILYSSPSQNST